MSKVVITLEDIGDNKVKVVCEPTFETMAFMVNSGNQLTAAQGYALAAINAIRKAAREQSNKLPFFIPRIGKW